MHLIPINFVMIGAAATLSASLYAPVTAVILICNLIPNGFELFTPLLLCSFISYLFSKRLLPYNVYTYENYLISKK
jgi:CIC family chloride channel protein